MPAKAICPSDSCPAQPVRIVSDRPHSANTRIVVYSRWRDGWVTTSGSTIAATTSSDEPPRSRWRTHQIVAQALGDRPPLGREREGLGLTPRLAALEVHRDEHAEEEEEVDQAGLVEIVEADDRLHDADGDAGDERPRERHHAADDRGGQRRARACSARASRGRSRLRLGPP